MNPNNLGTNSFHIAHILQQQVHRGGSNTPVHYEHVRYFRGGVNVGVGGVNVGIPPAWLVFF